MQPETYGRYTANPIPNSMKENGPGAAQHRSQGQKSSRVGGCCLPHPARPLRAWSEAWRLGSGGSAPHLLPSVLTVGLPACKPASAPRAACASPGGLLVPGCPGPERVHENNYSVPTCFLLSQAPGVAFAEVLDMRDEMALFSQGTSGERCPSSHFQGLNSKWTTPLPGS